MKNKQNMNQKRKIINNFNVIIDKYMLYVCILNSNLGENQVKN